MALGMMIDEVEKNHDILDWNDPTSGLEENLVGTGWRVV